MKAIFFLLLSLAIFYKISFCQTQSQLTRISSEADKKAEKRLNSIYQKILKLYSDDTLFVENLKISQQAWLQYRNAEIKAMYPDYPPGYYGSMLSMCVTSYSKKLTENRIHELEKWLMGSEQGDCGSSIKSKEELPPYTNH